MVNPVHFSQAIATAIKDKGTIQMALEVGPHPALKGPVSRRLTELGINIPYVGTLSRSQSDMTSFADCLGSI
jgi:hybrid polyketide synthase / nonribosomal peptide synthetase ACE1